MLTSREGERLTHLANDPELLTKPSMSLKCTAYSILLRYLHRGLTSQVISLEVSETVVDANKDGGRWKSFHCYASTVCRQLHPMMMHRLLKWTGWCLVV